jgi:hypothetical protein
VSIRFAALLIVGALSLTAQTPEALLLKVKSTIAASRPAALTALDEFKQLAKGNPEKYGFRSADELARATVGDDPIVSFLVPVGRLRNYARNASPFTLLTGGDKVIYPVVSSSQLRSSMIIDKFQEGWKAAAFGGTELIQRITQQKSRLSKDAVTILVEVAAPPNFLLGELRGTQLFLIPLIDEPDLRLKAGLSEPAAQIFSQLVPAARTYNGLPR